MERRGCLSTELCLGYLNDACLMCKPKYKPNTERGHRPGLRVPQAVTEEETFGDPGSSAATPHQLPTHSCQKGLTLIMPPWVLSTWHWTGAAASSGGSVGKWTQERKSRVRPGKGKAWCLYSLEQEFHIPGMEGKVLGEVIPKFLFPVRRKVLLGVSASSGSVSRVPCGHSVQPVAWTSRHCMWTPAKVHQDRGPAV